VSLDFHACIMRMRLLRKLDFPEMKFPLYFMACITDAGPVLQDDGRRRAWTLSQRGILAFTHNCGTEEDAGFKYHDGNAQPRGFGHICASVPGLAAAVSWFENNQATSVKRRERGKMRIAAFLRDRDGYWIKIVQANLLKQLGQP
jgi:lactoylglutathione lyase